MLKCRRCKCNCDPSDLVNGLCLECLEEERQEQLRTDAVLKIMNSGHSQMELTLEV